MALVVTPTAAWAQCGADCSRPVSSTQVHTRYANKSVVRAHTVTRFRDVDNTRHVTHTKRIVTITRVQPITRINLVTRVHTRTKILRVNQKIAVKRFSRSAERAGETSRVAFASNGDRVTTTYRHRTMRPVRFVTRYRDVYRTRYVTRVTYRWAGGKTRKTVSIKVATRVQNRTATRGGRATVAAAGPTMAAKVAPRVQLAALDAMLP
jgi:hypothetical protein